MVGVLNMYLVRVLGHLLGLIHSEGESLLRGLLEFIS